jgi:hypothetical protein
VLSTSVQPSSGADGGEDRDIDPAGLFDDGLHEGLDRRAGTDIGLHRPDRETVALGLCLEGRGRHLVAQVGREDRPFARELAAGGGTDSLDAPDDQRDPGSGRSRHGFGSAG